MMKLQSINYYGNIHKTVAKINDQGVDRFVFSIAPISPSATVVVFRVESYPEYEWFCKKMGKEPMTTAEYFR